MASGTNAREQQVAQNCLLFRWFKGAEVAFALGPAECHWMIGGLADCSPHPYYCAASRVSCPTSSLTLACFV
eukprot:1092818-Alexandrium_andersonii.AAC.1